MINRKSARETASEASYFAILYPPPLKEKKVQENKGLRTVFPMLIGMTSKFMCWDFCHVFSRMKPELISILFVTSLDKGRQTDVSVKKIHDSWKLNGNTFVKLFLGDLDEKMTLTGYRRKRNKKESETVWKPGNFFLVSMNHKANTCSSSIIHKETVTLALFLKQSWITLIICLPAHVSCGRDKTELDYHKAQPKWIFSVGTKIWNRKKLLCQVKTETNKANLLTQPI